MKVPVRRWLVVPILVLPVLIFIAIMAFVIAYPLYPADQAYSPLAIANQILRAAGAGGISGSAAIACRELSHRIEFGLRARGR